MPKSQVPDDPGVKTYDGVATLSHHRDNIDIASDAPFLLRP